MLLPIDRHAIDTVLWFGSHEKLMTSEDNGHGTRRAAAKQVAKDGAAWIKANRGALLGKSTESRARCWRRAGRGVYHSHTTREPSVSYAPQWRKPWAVYLEIREVGWMTGFEPATSGATVRRSATELHPP